MEVLQSKKNRKPIFNPKNSRSSVNMYQTSPQVFRPATHVSTRASPVNHRSTIVYSPRKSQPKMYACQSVKQVQPNVNIKMCSPINLPKRTVVHQPQAVAISPMPRASYSVSKFTHTPQVQPQPQPQVIVRPASEFSPEVTRTFVPIENMQSSMMKSSQIKSAAVNVERVMRPLGENVSASLVDHFKPVGERISASIMDHLKPVEENISASIMDHYKPAYSTFDSSFSQIRQPKDIQIVQAIHRKIDGNDKIHDLAVMNNVLTAHYDELYGQLQDLKKCEVEEKEIIEQDILYKKMRCQIENIFNLETFQSMGKLHEIEKKMLEKGKGKICRNESGCSGCSWSNSFYR